MVVKTELNTDKYDKFGFFVKTVLIEKYIFCRSVPQLEEQ